MSTSPKQFARLITSKKTGEVLNKTIVTFLKDANQLYNQQVKKYGNDFNFSIEPVKNPTANDILELSKYKELEDDGLNHIINTINDADPEFISMCNSRNICTDVNVYKTMSEIISCEKKLLVPCTPSDK